MHIPTLRQTEARHIAQIAQQSVFSFACVVIVIMHAITSAHTDLVLKVLGFRRFNGPE